MQSEPESSKVPCAVESAKASLACVIILILFSLTYLTLSLWILVDLWIRDKEFITCILSIKKEKLAENLTFVMALYTFVGALLGNATLDLVSYHKYWAIKRDFQASHVPGYFFGPWLAGTIGLIIFCLLQSGLFIFSGGATQKIDIEETAISKMGYISVGFLSGFGWMNAVEKIQEIVSRFFSTDAKNVNNREAKPTDKDIQGIVASDGAQQVAQSDVSAPGGNPRKAEAENVPSE